MKIREDQDQALQNERRREFINELKAWLRENHPEDLRFVSDSLLDKRVRWGIQKAQTHGLTWARSLSIFVNMMVVAGANFDQAPPVKAVLEDPTLPPDERIDRMMKTVTTEQWAEIRKRSNSQEWAPAKVLETYHGE